METELRALLYNQLEGHQVAFNPLEPEPFDLVDLTRDVTNSTRIYHLRTECVREALAGAAVIVTDNPPLAEVVRRVLPRTVIMALPFGQMPATLRSTRRGAVARTGDELTVGLLNHNGDVELSNVHHRKLLKQLQPGLVYGRALPGLDAEVEEDFKAFCSRCDILLLPSLPGAINSMTLPLAAMAAGCAVLAHNAPGYYDLDAATGVQILPNELEAWRSMLVALVAQPAKVRAMQERNQAFAARLNRESLQRAGLLLAGPLPHGPAPAGDCGCDQKRKKRGRKAPTKPA